MSEYVHCLRLCSGRLGIDQAYHDTHKTHAMATCHRDAGCLVDDDINLHMDDVEDIHTGPVDDNKNTTGIDMTVRFGGPEAEFPHNNQEKLAAPMKEIHHLCQQIATREDQPMGGLDHIKWELQNLSLMLQAQTTSTPTPTEPIREVICQYTDTLCATQKQTNQRNLLLQDITIFNDHDSSNLEDWLTDIEKTADLTNERCTKLAMAKSSGLTHTLVTEAINLHKSWDDIKNLLQL